MAELLGSMSATEQVPAALSEPTEVHGTAKPRGVLAVGLLAAAVPFLLYHRGRTRDHTAANAGEYSTIPQTPSKAPGVSSCTIKTGSGNGASRPFARAEVNPKRG